MGESILFLVIEGSVNHGKYVSLINWDLKFSLKYKKKMVEELVFPFAVVSIFLCISLCKIIIHYILEVNGVDIFLLTGFLA